MSLGPVMSTLPAWSMHAAPAELPELLLHASTAGVRLAAGVLLWRLNPTGRWLHLVAWIVLVIQHIRVEIETGDNPMLLALPILGGLMVLGMLWIGTKPVFEPDDRDAVIPVTGRKLRWSAGFLAIHGLLALVTAGAVLQNLP